MKNKVFLAITIDVERDCGPNWETSNPMKFSSVVEGIPNRLQPLFNKYEAVPTYLISPEVLKNKDCVEVFKNLKGIYELGTHLHSEFIEPYYVLDNDGKKASAMQCFYPYAVEKGKIKNLTELFKKSFGFMPTSFRAGRFAADVDTLSILADLGYKVDLSVTPHICWRDKAGVLDFVDAPDQPYFPSESDINKRGFLPILEIPVTIFQNSMASSIFVSKVLGRRIKQFLFRPLWLRPTFSTGKQMIFVIKQFIKKYVHLDKIFLVMMFHSMEVVPGVSPYTSSEEECKEFLLRIEEVLSFCIKNNIRFIKAQDIREYFL
ncbi:MAG: hypothetical protein N2643_04440 [Endomicrobia bacterium]|nr:hypothetical protein [Endomicrobiia bacterium]